MISPINLFLLMLAAVAVIGIVFHISRTLYKKKKKKNHRMAAIMAERTVRLGLFGNLSEEEKAKYLEIVDNYEKLYGENIRSN